MSLTKRNHMPRSTHHVIGFEESFDKKHGEQKKGLRERKFVSFFCLFLQESSCVRRNKALHLIKRECASAHNHPKPLTQLIGSSNNNNHKKEKKKEIL